MRPWKHENIVATYKYIQFNEHNIIGKKYKVALIPKDIAFSDNKNLDWNTVNEIK